MTDIVARLRSSEPLPICPFDRLSPQYLRMAADKPCPFCGQENTLDGPDKCRGADSRIMGEAANEIERLRAALKPFSDIAQFVTETQRDSRPIIFGMDNVIVQRLTIGHLRAARLALSTADHS